MFDFQFVIKHLYLQFDFDVSLDPSFIEEVRQLVKKEKGIQ